MTWTQTAYAAVADLVNQRTGLSFDTRQDSAELGIRRAMTRAKVAELDRYLDLISANEAALGDLVNELTIGETYFFREPAQFQFIQRVVLPDIRQRHGNEHGIRVWSAACASGEEAFSLAILLEQHGMADRSHLVATDISSTALAKARRAVYEAWSLRGGQLEGALAYLTLDGKSYHLHESIRRRVTFAYLNLALDMYPSFANGIWGMDLILCRNVLIYFDRDTIRCVAQRLHETLAPGGWLLMASADPPLWEHAPFEVVVADEGVFYRRVSSTVPGGSPVILDPPMSDADPVIHDEQPAPDDELQKPANEVQSTTGAPLDDATAAALHVRSLANRDPAGAERVCADATASYPLSAELHYLHAVLLMGLSRPEDALAALKRVLYLDRSLAAAHFIFASILRDHGDTAGAVRAFRNARDLCRPRPPEETVPLADGESAGRLAEIAQQELSLLEGAEDKT